MESLSTGELAFDAAAVRDLIGLAKRRARVRALVARAVKRPYRGGCRLELVKDSAVYVTSPGVEGVCAYAEGCNPERDPFAPEVSEILFSGPDCRTSVDVAAVQAWAGPDARRVVVQLVRADALPRALLAYRVEPRH
jgi:hypothetical protein